jgi:hypothetical protein
MVNEKSAMSMNWQMRNTSSGKSKIPNNGYEKSQIRSQITANEKCQIMANEKCQMRNVKSTRVMLD